MKEANQDTLDLLESIRPDTQQPGDITSAMASEMWGTNKTTSIKHLRDKLIPLGYKEIKNAILDNGAHGVVFRPPTKE